MAVLTEEIISQLTGNLMSKGLLTTEEMANLSAEARAKDVPFLTYLRESNKVDEEELVRATALAMGKKYVNLLDAHVDAEVLHKIPYDLASKMMAVPVAVDDKDILQIAVLDPDNLQLVDLLNNAAKQPIEVVMASGRGIKNVLSQYQLDITQDIDDTQEVGEPGEPAPNADNFKTIAQDSPISQIIAKLLDYAARQNASDIHIEPTNTQLLVRVRIDGILREVTTLPKSLEAAIVSRIKILANLKIDEHRKPQDGQFTAKVADMEIDLRIAISPTIWGEQIVIRLLKKEAVALQLESMGLTGHALRTVRENLRRSGGMILISGPTGSGKTTTLYAMIREIATEEINIVTLEDPVEYKMDGVNQIQVDPAVGLTFADGLRSILRQDPDVIMVGEIRDSETAELAVQAALTGHLVFATLHTNSASGILPRLTDMGVEPFLIASTVNVAISQRLVRSNIMERETVAATANEVASINDTVGNLLAQNEGAQANVASDLGYENLPILANEYNLSMGKQTANSPDGFKGRTGIFEAFNVTSDIQELVIKQATSAQIERLAIDQHGMITMRQDGYLKALNGDTTLSEVNRVANIVV